MQAVHAIRSVYPDALVVTRPEIAAGCPSTPGRDRRRRRSRDGAGGAARGRRWRARNRRAGESLLLDRLVVVVGCGRSGTTWLEELLAAHPDIARAPRTESWIFQQLEPLWTAYDASLSAHLDRERFRRVLRRFCDRCWSPDATGTVPEPRSSSRRRRCSSLPVPLIADIYPDAWVVHLIRDGRDVARSVSQVPFFRLPDPADAARMWARVVSTVRRDAVRCARYREIRYEQARRPGGRRGRHVGWLGLDVAPGVAGRVASMAGERVSAHAGTAMRVGPGGWRSLPAADVARIYRAVGGLLVSEGYASRREWWLGRLAPSRAGRPDREGT